MFLKKSWYCNVKLKVQVNVLLLLCSFGLWFPQHCKIFDFLITSGSTCEFFYFHGTLKQNGINIQKLCHLKKSKNAIA